MHSSSNDEPDYWPYDDPAYDTPINQAIMKTLLQSLQRGANQIRLHRIPSTDNTTGSVTIYFRIGDAEQMVAEPPFELWPKIVNRLKIMARMVDYGPRRSTDGQIVFRVSKNRSVTFRITSNPNPYVDNEVILVYEKELNERTRRGTSGLRPA